MKGETQPGMTMATIVSLLGYVEHVERVTYAILPAGSNGQCTLCVRL